MHREKGIITISLLAIFVKFISFGSTKHFLASSNSTAFHDLCCNCRIQNFQTKKSMLLTYLALIEELTLLKFFYATF